jgi:hypothetical protein
MKKYIPNNISGISYAIALTLCLIVLLGWILLKLFDRHYFLWVFVVWLVLSIVIAFAGKVRGVKYIGRLLMVLLVLVIAGKSLGLIQTEINTDRESGEVYTDGFPPGVSLDDIWSSITGGYSTPYYEYKNCIWYGPELGNVTRGGSFPKERIELPMDSALRIVCL